MPRVCIDQRIDKAVPSVAPAKGSGEGIPSNAMDVSPGDDRMDWSPSSPPLILYQSQEPWSGTVAGQRRTFEQFSDGTEPRGRQNGGIQPVYVPRYGPGQPRFFPPDENMGTIPRLAWRAGLCAWYLGEYVLGCLGQGVGYTNVAIKRRLVNRWGARPAGSTGQYETPRQRRRRNIYLTPRQMYEQRSLRSIRIRDMPGRYPGYPQSYYTEADSHGQHSQQATDSQANCAPELRDVAFGDPLDVPYSPQLDSPLVLKQRRTAPAITSDDQLTQEVDIPLPGAIEPAQPAPAITIDDQLTQEADILLPGAVEPALQKSDSPLISTLDEDLDQEKKRKEAPELTTASSLEAAPTPLALSFDFSDSSDSDEQLTDSDTAPTSPNPTSDTSSQLQEETESEILNSRPYDPNSDPTLAIVPEAEGLDDWEMELMEESYFVPMVHKQKRRPTTYRRAVDIKKLFKNSPLHDKDSPAKTTTPATDAIQDETDDSLIASDEEEEQEQENTLDCLDPATEVEVSSSPSVAVPTLASTEEPLATAAEATFEADVESGVCDKVDEPAACSAESSDNSRSSVLAASISPQRSALSPLHHNAVSATRQQTSSQSHVPPTGSTPNLMSALARYFGFRGLNFSPQTPTSRTRHTSSRIRKTVGFYESPETGRPVTRTKRFVIGESIDHPSPLSSRDESSLLNDDSSQSGRDMSATGADQIALDSQLQTFQPDISSESGLISPALGEVSNDSTETFGENAAESRNEDIEMSDAPIESLENGTGEGNADHATEESQSQEENTDIEEAEDHVGEDDGNRDEAQDGAPEKEEDRLGEDGGDGNEDQDDESQKEEDRLGEDDSSDEEEKDNASEQEEDHVGEDNGGADEEKEDESTQEENSPSNGVRTDQDASMGESGHLNPSQDENGAEGDRHEEDPSGENNGQPTTPPTRKPLARKGGKKIKRKDLSGALEELSIVGEINVSPRRVSTRRRSLAEKEAQEKAAQEKKEAEEKAKREKEEAERRAQLEREAEEQRRELGGRQYTKEPAIQPLSAEWNRKVDEAMNKGSTAHIATTSSGNSISRREMGMVLPQQGDDPSGWLNDEIIAGYLQAVVDYGNARFNLRRGDTPKLHAFNSFFYTNLRKPGGYEHVKRWARRAKVGGADLLKVEWVFIPVNVGGNHWTLAVVSPVRKTIEYFDSMHGSATAIVNNIRAWLAGELQTAYVADEWVVRDDDEGRYIGRGKGPTQNNGSDCGVFTVTTAKLISLGIEPLAFSARDTPLQRRRIVAELMNGGFNGDFVPQFEFA